MSDLITCPAPLRANSPAALVQDVYVSAPGYGEVALLRKGERVTVIEVADTFARVALRSPTVAPATGSASWLTYPVEVSALAVDLTDATGRAHAAWWVGSATGLDGQIWTLLTGRVLVFGDMVEGRSVFGAPTSPVRGYEDWEVVEALAHLDPTDDTRLPDGSRRVDALALKAVVEHLLTQRSAK